MKTITVMRGGAIGDFVLTLPAIAALRSAYPETCLRLIGHPATLCLAHPDQILDQESRELAPLHTTDLPLPPASAALFADVDLLLAYIVDPDGALTDSLRTLVRGPLLVHDPRPPVHSRIHITDHLLEPLRRHGISIPDPTPRILLRAEDRFFAAICWRQRDLRPPTAVVHPGSGGIGKCWPLENFLELIDQLQQRGVHVLLLCGPVEADQQRIPASVRSLQPPGLLELAGLLERADLFIGNDSGPGHIAAAVGTPTLILFGPTDPRVWRPRGRQAHILQAPAGRLGALAVNSVHEAACAILEGSDATPGVFPDD